MSMLWECYTGDTSAKWKHCGLQHVGPSMDKTLEATLLGRGSVVLDVWYYCCAYVVYIVHVRSVILCACSVVHI